MGYFLSKSHLFHIKSARDARLTSEESENEVKPDLI